MFIDESEGKVSFSLRPDERDLIVEHAATINSTLMQRLRLGVLTGKTLVYTFSVPDLEGLLDGLASEARHASNRKLRRRFQRLYERLVLVLDRYQTQGSDRGFDEPPAMFADFKSEVRAAIEGQDFRDIDELNIKIQDIAYERNRAPQKDFSGLSPLQVGGLIYTDWLTPNSGLQLNSEIPLLDLNAAELLSNARIFLQAIAEGGKTKATSADNLNRKFVAEMVEQMNWPPGFLDHLKEYHKVWNEEDVFPLHVLRITLETAGLIRKFKGSFLITKKGETLSNDSKAGMLFMLLFNAFFRKFNLGYLDRYPECDSVQHTIAFSFCMLSRYAKNWEKPDDLADKIFLPSVFATIPALSIVGHCAPGIARSRIFRPLERFGLLECRFSDESSHAFSEIAHVRKTPLFDKFISFDLSDRCGP